MPDQWNVVQLSNSDWYSESISQEPYTNKISYPSVKKCLDCGYVFPDVSKESTEFPGGILV